MSNNQHQSYPSSGYGPATTPATPPPAGPRRKRWGRSQSIVASIFAALAVFVVGFGAGSSSGTAPATTAAAQAAPAKTETVTITETPASCKTALEAADTVMTTAGAGFQIVADALGAAAEFDIDGVTAATEKLTTLTSTQMTPQIEAYKTARDECRAS